MWSTCRTGRSVSLGHGRLFGFLRLRLFWAILLSAHLVDIYGCQAQPAPVARPQLTTPSGPRKAGTDSRRSSRPPKGPRDLGHALVLRVNRRCASEHWTRTRLLSGRSECFWLNQTEERRAPSFPPVHCAFHISPSCPTSVARLSVLWGNERVLPAMKSYGRLRRRARKAVRKPLTWCDGG